MSPRDRLHWIAFGAVAATGVGLAIVVDFVVRYPVLVMALAGASFVVTRPVPPFTAVYRVLRYRYDLVARYGGVVAVTAVVTTMVLLVAVGVRPVLLLVAGVWLLDRVVAWLVSGPGLVGWRSRADNDDGWRVREPVQCRVAEDGRQW